MSTTYYITTYITTFPFGIFPTADLQNLLYFYYPGGYSRFAIGPTGLNTSQDNKLYVACYAILNTNMALNNLISATPFSSYYEVPQQYINYKKNYWISIGADLSNLTNFKNQLCTFFENNKTSFFSNRFWNYKFTFIYSLY